MQLTNLDWNHVIGNEERNLFKVLKDLKVFKAFIKKYQNTYKTFWKEFEKQSDILKSLVKFWKF